MRSSLRGTTLYDVCGGKIKRSQIQLWALFLMSHYNFRHLFKLHYFISGIFWTGCRNFYSRDRFEIIIIVNQFDLSDSSFLSPSLSFHREFANYDAGRRNCMLYIHHKLIWSSRSKHIELFYKSHTKKFNLVIVTPRTPGVFQCRRFEHSTFHLITNKRQRNGRKRRHEKTKDCFRFYSWFFLKWLAACFFTMFPSSRSF